MLALQITTSRSIRLVLRLNRSNENEWDTNEFLDSIDTQSEAGRGQIVMHATPEARIATDYAAWLGFDVCP